MIGPIFRAFFIFKFHKLTKKNNFFYNKKVMIFLSTSCIINIRRRSIWKHINYTKTYYALI